MLAQGCQNPAIHLPGCLRLMSQVDTNRDILVYWLTIDYSCRTMCPEMWTVHPFMVNQGYVLLRGHGELVVFAREGQDNREGRLVPGWTMRCYRRPISWPRNSSKPRTGKLRPEARSEGGPRR